ncbi:flagellar motor switch protein FliN [Lysobacter enzymogenes]|uniref:flagellar motor switch protein FliN n=1 Tax=Lysobacter enzymogenes TaxID=69 RepID=UPI001A972624|nr:flagellar motor switch protein FliN [Lysobacter enzymogenes]QQP94336.1 flagellar motor switch protein FliN [Lysobacter enzymogenes]
MNTPLGVSKIDIMQIDLPEHAAAAPVAGDKPGQRIPLDMLGEIAVKVEIQLGTARLTVKELMALQAGSMLTLDQHLSQDVDVLLNERVVARGEVVAVGDHFGVRIKQLGAA